MFQVLRVREQDGGGPRHVLRRRHRLNRQRRLRRRRYRGRRGGHGGRGGRESAAAVGRRGLPLRPRHVGRGQRGVVGALLRAPLGGAPPGMVMLFSPVYIWLHLFSSSLTT